MVTTPQQFESPPPAAESATTAAARTTPGLQLTDTEPQLDMRALRAWRLQRLRGEMARRELAGCVLFNPLSVRYATGYRNCAAFATHILSYHVFVATDGPVVLFDGGPQAERVAAGLESIDELRPASPMSLFYAGNRGAEWARRFAEEIASLVGEHGGGSRRVAIERPSFSTWPAFEGLGLTLVDGAEVVETARVVKGPEEVMCINAAVAVAEIGMARMREALRPGITEVALWSLLHQANIEHGGDWIECRLLASGERTNPWLQEAGSRMVRPGELVAFDTDLIGPFGYCADISRTYHCGPGRPSEAQRDLYRRAFEEVQHNIALVRPGLGLREWSERAYRQPERFVANRYPVIAHGVGMSDEYPVVFYPQDAGTYGYDGVLEPGMVMSVESYVGESGGAQGVKLEEQVLVTESGCTVLSRFPFEESLLG